MGGRRGKLDRLDRLDKLDKLDKLDRLYKLEPSFSAMSPERDVAFDGLDTRCWILDASFQILDGTSFRRSVTILKRDT